MTGRTSSWEPKGFAEDKIGTCGFGSLQSWCSHRRRPALAFAPRPPEASDLTTLRLTAEDGGTAIPGLITALGGEGITVAGVEVRRPTLDDVFLTLTGRSLRDEQA